MLVFWWQEIVGFPPRPSAPTPLGVEPLGSNA